MATFWETLRKQTDSNTLKISPQKKKKKKKKKKKNESFQIKILIFFIFLLKNIDNGYSLEPPRRGGSNEYP